MTEKMAEPIRICIYGGGSLGHVCAGVFASQKDVEVNILSGHPDLWQKKITVTDDTGKVYDGLIHNVSKKTEDVVSNQDIILLCLPGYMIEEALNRIKPFIGNALVGTVVSSTGFFFFAHKILGSNSKLFGFQRVPYISRVNEYGQSARLLGYKPTLAAVFENVENSDIIRQILERLFLTPITLLNNYYEVSLSNSNPILHTGRLYSMYQGRELDTFDHDILFYKEWTDDASQLLINMDCEFFLLLDKIGVHSIPSLLDYYECTDAASLTKKISSIPAFQTIGSPMIETSDGWRIDFHSRYFTEDFPFGLRWIKELADFHNIKTPNINKVYEWGLLYCKS